MEKIYKLNVLTCRSQVLNPVGLRRFPSPHPSLFFWNFGGIFGLKWGGNGGSDAYIRGVPRSPDGGATGPPCRPRGGRQPLLPRPWAGPSGRPRGGDRPPFFCQGPRSKFNEKNYNEGLSPYGGRPGVVLKYFKMDIYFWNFDFV